LYGLPVEWQAEPGVDLGGIPDAAGRSGGRRQPGGGEQPVLVKVEQFGRVQHPRLVLDGGIEGDTAVPAGMLGPACGEVTVQRIIEGLRWPATASTTRSSSSASPDLAEALAPWPPPGPTLARLLWHCRSAQTNHYTSS